MKNRTKIELVVFVIAAAIFIASQLSGKTGEKPEEPLQTIEAQMQTPAETSASTEKPEIQEQQSSSDSQETPEEQTEVQVPEQTAAAVTISAAEPETTVSAEITETSDAVIAEDGSYTDKDSVALYISVYGHLPSNFITKDEARNAGWVASKGNLDKVCPGMSIGGDHFGNYEGNLPKKKGRKYFECDINFDPKDGHRGAERIIYSNDGLIYYTKDHYKNFELLYGEP